MPTAVLPPTELTPLEELAHAHRPAQLAVLGHLVPALSATTAVTHLLVRGSLATGTADRLSEVDLVVAVRDDRLPALMDSLDAPVARATDAGRVGQHGLEIVMAVAQGFEVQREPVGKRITARIALPDDPGGDITGHRPQ